MKIFSCGMSIIELTIFFIPGSTLRNVRITHKAAQKNLDIYQTIDDN